MKPGDTAHAVEGLLLALDLFEAGEDMMRQTLRRQFPEGSDEEIELAAADEEEI